MGQIILTQNQQQSTGAHHIPMGHIILTQGHIILTHNQQQSTGAHHIPMGHIILTQNQQQSTGAHHIPMGQIILTQNQQQSTGAHHIPMGHIILTQNQQLCILTCLSLLSKELSNDIVIVLFWFLLFKPTEDQTDNRPHSKQARRQSYNRHGMYL
jgi:hypothetical protein